MFIWSLFKLNISFFLQHHCYISFFFFFCQSLNSAQLISKASMWDFFFFFCPAPAHSHRIFDQYHPLLLRCHPTQTSLHRDSDHFSPATVFSIENHVVLLWRPCLPVFVLCVQVLELDATEGCQKNGNIWGLCVL